MDPSARWVDQATQILIDIGQSLAAKLERPKHLLDPIERALREMEDQPEFNAGYGAALQADGQARVSAALMDGTKQSFSGVIGATHLKHPSALARHLQNHSSRVVAEPGCELLAREMAEPINYLITPKRLEQWQSRVLDPAVSCDTVGAVFWHPEMGLAAGTSTGGRGFEFPGRVTDSATVAGNYASSFAAISATGIGEEIVDDALAARMETRCRDGLPLAEASHRCLREALERGRSYGWIGAARDGHWAIAHTTPVMTYVVLDPEGQIIAASRPEM
jgi:L-asparaginase